MGGVCRNVRLRRSGLSRPERCNACAGWRSAAVPIAGISSSSDYVHYNTTALTNSVGDSAPVRGGAMVEKQGGAGSYRIGLLVPSSNTTVEPEFYRALPANVTLHTARLLLTQIKPEAILKLVEDLEAQSRLLASADVDVIVLGATAPSFLKGRGYDSEVTARIEQASGKR